MDQGVKIQLLPQRSFEASEVVTESAGFSSANITALISPDLIP